MERKFIFSEGEYYHVYNRGNNKSEIFKDSNDYRRFIKLLFLCNGKNGVVMKSIPDEKVFDFDRGEQLVYIGAYCLMPNHFHILTREKASGGISRFLGKVLTAYSMYFNKKYKRTGRLFENTFRGRHIDDDRYLKYMFSYIHLNPIKLTDPGWRYSGVSDLSRVKDFLYKYEYSSLIDFVSGGRKEKEILNISEFPEYLNSGYDVEKHLDDWLMIGEVIQDSIEDL